MVVLKVHSLTKKYGNLTALDHVSFEVSKGQVLGLLGPNGSGKTTTLGILLGVTKQNEGDFSWFGNGSLDDNRKRIGALLETPNFFPYLNAIDNLKIVGKIKNVANIKNRSEDVLKTVGLLDRAKDKFRTYSLGMKQRLAIASALLSNPDVLVLDEPTNGLDPQGIAEIRDLIQAIAKQGKTIIIASHILDEIEKICSHVLILRNGKLLSSSTMSDILTQDTILSLKTDDINLLRETLNNSDAIEIVLDENNFILVKTSLKSAQVNQYLTTKGIYLSELTIKKKSLESIFLETLSQNL
mgnify:FL=1